jgi:TolA-binding protein
MATGAPACAPDRGSAFAQALAEGRRAYAAGRYVSAAESYARAARDAKIPRDAVFARYEGALARLRAGDTEAGARELSAIAEASPKNAYSGQAAMRLARLARGADEERGLRELESVALRFPDEGVARAALLDVLRAEDAAHGPAATLAHLERLAPKLDASPLGETVAYERAKRLSELARTADARDAFHAVARRWPYPFGALFDDALVHASEEEEKLGKPADAAATLEGLLSHRETSDVLGSYQRPRYSTALLHLAELYATKLGDHARARDALHRLYAEFKTSTLRDDALWREADLLRQDGDGDGACDRLGLLVKEFPDSRYVPCATVQCRLTRPTKSKAPSTCRAYVTTGTPAASERGNVEAGVTP